MPFEQEQSTTAIPRSGTVAQRPTGTMNRRSFLNSIGVAGAGLLGVSSLAACDTGTRAATTGIEGLRSAIRGRVLLPGDTGFQDASRPWNLAITQRVRAVVEIADSDDASATVAFAKDSGFAVSTQPTGHGAADGLDGVILVRTRQLNELRIDPDTRTARVGAGVPWGQVLSAGAPHGLLGLAGSSPAINVTGFTLGGGLSWFGRKYGWASDSVTAFDGVDAHGTARRITAESDPDLFWAMRGGGGDFALVTAIEFDLHPAPTVFGGRIAWPAERAPEVMAAFREATLNAPEELTLWMTRMQLPARPGLVAVAMTYLGEEPDARALLAPFDRIDGRIADTRRVLPIGELGTIMSEPTSPDASISSSEFLSHIDDTAAAALLQPTSMAGMQIRHVGGAWARQSGSAAGPVAASYCVVVTGIPRIAGSVTAIDSQLQHFQTALSPALAGRKAFTFLTPGDTAAQAFTAHSIERLRDIKRRRDPKNVLRSNYPVLA